MQYAIVIRHQAQKTLRSLSRPDRSRIEMTLQKIKSLDGKDEYVLLPIAVFRASRGQIEQRLAGRKAAKTGDDDYLPFVLEDYVDNPVALARIKAKITQAELARRMNVSQAYVSKVEAQVRVSNKVRTKVDAALSRSAK
jgi:DNA-binding XRE family transcriptional regulator